MRAIALSVVLVAMLGACGSKVEPPIGAAPATLSEIDALGANVAREINLLRNDPFAYSVRVKAMKSYFRHSPSCEPPADPCRLVLPGEVVIAVTDYQAFDAQIDDTVEVLRETEAVRPFAPSRALKAAAQAHADAMGSRSTPSHDGDSLRDRINQYGSAQGRIGEAISFGQQTAFGVVSAWLVDRNMSDKLHRKLLLDPDMSALGVACAPSNTHRVACVATFADSVAE